MLLQLYSNLDKNRAKKYKYLNSLLCIYKFYLNNLFIGTTSVYDFSGQYLVDSLEGATSSYITLDISSNVDFVTTQSYFTYLHIVCSLLYNVA